MTTDQPRADAIAAPPCEFVPAHEPWTCRVHNGVRTSLDEPQCDAIRPAKPLTPEDPRPAGPWTGDPADYDGDEGR